jgi:hypothetical protein
MKWARRHGFPWDESVVREAAGLPDLKIFKWLISHGCPFHVDVVQDKMEQDCPSLEKVLWMKERGWEIKNWERIKVEGRISIQLMMWLDGEGKANRRLVDRIDPRLGAYLAKMESENEK